MDLTCTNKCFDKSQTKQRNSILHSVTVSSASEEKNWSMKKIADRRELDTNDYNSRANSLN